jgi:hypothetical protein
MAGTTPLQIAALSRRNRLDAVGPWEVLSRLPEVEMRFVAQEVGPMVTEGNVLLLGATHDIVETPPRTSPRTSSGRSDATYARAAAPMPPPATPPRRRALR